MNTEEILGQDLVNELNSTLSAKVVRELYRGAASTLTWDKQAPSGVSFTEHILSFTAKLAQAENTILAQSGQLTGNISYIVGSDVAGILRAMPGFVPVTDVRASSGTHLYGTLDGRPVIRSLVMPSDEMIMATKSDDGFSSSVVYAPYMPLFISNQMNGQDHNPLKAQKVAATMCGIKSVNPFLSTKIKILNATI